MAHVKIINGPNLNLVGRRNPKIYGKRSMEQIILDVQRLYPEVQFTYLQSNHEGDLIDWIQQAEEPIIINAGGYTHTSVALRDAAEWAVEQGRIVVEVHLSDIYAREDFRQNSMLIDVCTKTCIGPQCYEEATQYILDHLPATEQ